MKNGFTLMEVLGVLMILAIIAVITTPIVMGVIKSSKEKAFLQSASSLETAARNYQSNNGFDETFTVNFANGNNLDKVKIDGETPDAGKLQINENGKVKLAIWNESLEMCVTKKFEEKSASVKEGKTKNTCVNLFSAL